GHAGHEALLERVANNSQINAHYGSSQRVGTDVVRMAVDEPRGVCRAHGGALHFEVREGARMMGETRIGFVGIGAMGARMAANLARAGYPLMVRDTDRAREQAFIESHQARAATSLAELGHGTDVVICMLPTGPVVRSVLLQEEDGALAKALAPGSVVIDM